MSMKQNDISPMCQAYPGTKELNGCAMDPASYERHIQILNAAQTQEAPAAPELPENAPASDPFAVEQDLRAIAAQAFDEDRACVQPQPVTQEAAVYRPGTAQSVCVEQPDSATSLTESVQKRLVFTTETVTRTGSGSFVTSGSFLTSGSYVTSGSYLWGSGSYLLTSGSYAWGGGSGSLTSGVRFLLPAPLSSETAVIGGFGIGVI